MTFDSKRYYKLASCIYKRLNQYDSLSQTERTFYLIDWLNMQVQNGGWCQWYHNWKDAERLERIEQTICALQEINAIDTIVLLQSAIALLDSGAACDDERLSELDDAHWAQPDGLGSLTLEWAEQRIEDFKLDA